MDNTGQLINYIVQELKRGVPDASIRSTLLQNGWPTEPVDRAFTILRQNDSAANSSPAAAPTVASLPDIGKQPYQQQPLTRPVQTTPSRGRVDYSNPKPYRKPLLIIFILLLLAAGGFGLYAYLNKPLSPGERDSARKDTLSKLANELSVYYTAQGSYPTREQINGKDFAEFQDGFKVDNFRDPTWSTDNKDCKSKEDTPVFVDARSDGCFTYRSTARNGGSCEGNDDNKCSRVVLTATLESGDPYIVVLDQNDKQEY